MKRSSPRDPVYPAEFNALFDEAFEEAAEELPLYTDAYKQQSWSKVKPLLLKRAKRRKRLHWLRQYKIIAVITAFVLFSAVLFTPPIVTQAVSPIYQELRNFGNGMSQIIFGNGRQLKDTSVIFANDSSDDMINPEELPCPKLFPLSMKAHMADLRDSLPFELPKIAYMPEGYMFNSAELITAQNPTPDSVDAGLMEGVYLLFETKKHEQLTMMFKTLKEDEIIRMPYEENIETLTLDNGTVAYYTPGRIAQITFMIGDICFLAAGQFDKSELLKIANGLNN
ncbi:hypothetical protein [Paenibacillus bouchesdurhonensis]|uniref:hypothetical protein n=1 Tax=Paenibacillus bouchesdurhonensis TaxID=1870990 RepID=UPI000DA63150|nr:hypothetical protein [Paenibacillus bouchesdurhonensis]